MKQMNEVVKRLKQLTLFSSCSDEELQRIVSATTQLRFAAGEVLAKEGAYGHELMVIVSGRVRVETGTHLLAELGAGEFFGEIALLDRGARTATVVAETDVVAEVISAGEFDGLLIRSPQLSRKLLVGLAGRLRQADLQLTDV